MTGEYDGLTVEQLWELVKQDDPDKLDEYAQGWTDAALVFDTELETLQGHYETVKTMWTSKSAGPYLEEIAKTMHDIELASREAKLRADSLSTVASNVRQANDRVKEQYDAWMVKKNAAHQADLDKAERILGGKASITDFAAATFNPEEERRPHDETARTYLNNSAESVTRQMKPVTMPVKEYKPIDFDSRWDSSDLKNIDFSGDDSQSFVADTSSAAVVGHGGPALQSGATPGASSTLPTGPAGPAPTGPGNLGAPPPAGLPSGGLSPVGRTPTPPSTRMPNTGIRLPRSTPPATRTPNLPGNRNTPGRSGGGRGMSNSPRTGNTGRGRTSGRGTGRGLTKSRMAPQDRTGRVRSSGEVMGRRGAGKPGEAEKPSNNRQVRRSIVGRNGAGRGGRGAVRGQLDRTKQGYTKQVLGSRNRFSSGFSRSPIVARKVHDAGTVFGKRPGPVSPEQQRRDRLEERHARKLAMERAAEGLARPVIGAGLVLSAQIEDKEPVKSTAEEDERDFWNPGQSTVSGIIGTRRPEPVVHHDPGPGVISTPSERPEPEHRPGPTAFQVDRESPKPDWLR